MFRLTNLQDVLDKIAEKAKSEVNNITKPEFAPEYLPAETKRDEAINAIIEIRALWDYVIKDANYNYPKVYWKLSIPISEEVEQECRRLEFGVYEQKTKSWLIKTSDEPEYEEAEYLYCYADVGFCLFENAPSDKGLVLVGSYTKMKQEPNLLKATEKAPGQFKNLKLPTLKLVVGAPGCGKTRFIVNNHQRGSLVLTSCSQGAQDVRERMAVKDNVPNTYTYCYKKSYRTVDSYLINSRDRYSTVWVDEGLMEHPGKIFLICLYTGCDNMYLLGDPNQIGYINRVKEVQLYYDRASMFYTPSQTLNTSYRCPVDVMALCADKYDGGAYSTSDVTLSMECKTFTGLDCVPKFDNVKYLVFKQVEKQKMKVAKYNVSTIHEFQGKEADDIIVVRMSRKEDEPLYKSQPHILVGISRHKKSLVYYTPVDDDMKKLIETPLCMADLDKIRKTVD